MEKLLANLCSQELRQWKPLWLCLCFSLFFVFEPSPSPLCISLFFDAFVLVAGGMSFFYTLGVAFFTFLAFSAKGTCSSLSDILAGP